MDRQHWWEGFGRRSLRKDLRAHDRAGLRADAAAMARYDDLLEGLWRGMGTGPYDAVALGRLAREVAHRAGLRIDDEAAGWIGLDLAFWWEESLSRYGLDDGGG